MASPTQWSATHGRRLVAQLPEDDASARDVVIGDGRREHPPHQPSRSPAKKPMSRARGPDEQRPVEQRVHLLAAGLGQKSARVACREVQGVRTLASLSMQTGSDEHHEKRPTASRDRCLETMRLRPARSVHQGCRRSRWSPCRRAVRHAPSSTNSRSRSEPPDNRHRATTG